MLRNLNWRIFYLIGWLLGIAAMAMPFGKIAWMDSGPIEVLGLAYLVHLLPFFPPVMIIYLLILRLYLCPDLSSHKGSKKIIAMIIVVIMAVNSGLIQSPLVGYYILAGSFSFFTLAIWCWHDDSDSRENENTNTIA
jgi:hypothetical protein